METILIFSNSESKNSLDEFNNFFKNNLNFEMKFVYRKNSDVYIKVKHEYVTNLFEIPFEKGKAFKANLQLIFYEDKESIGYFPKITLFEDGLTFPFELRP